MPTFGQHLRARRVPQLVAAGDVADYLERIREVSKATEPDDLYHDLDCKGGSRSTGC
jgi:hypothetical protein